jgi:phage terminase small subunit
MKQSATTEIVGEAMAVATSEDEQAIIAAGGAIQTFLKGLGAFFRAAKIIEHDADTFLAVAKGWTAPTSAAEDVKLQLTIKSANADKRKAVEHWDHITSLATGFHKRMVAGRKRPVEALDQVAAIGNALHNGWTEAELRRVREEQARLEREEEARARREREQELADLEAAAVKAEEGSPELSAREQTFVDLYFSTRNGTTSATRAGFKDGMKTAARLLTMPKITKAIEAKRVALELRQKAAVVERAPLETRDVDATPAQIGKAPGAHDRTTKSAEIIDASAFVEALLSGNYGIPSRTVMPDQTALNDYARSMGELINHWPGIRLKVRTGVV